MIQILYPIFQHWSATGSIMLLSDTHFADSDCKIMDEHWIAPDEQVAILNRMVNKTDTFIHLGDVGDPSYIRQLKVKHKVLILGNHDRISDYRDVFDEIYSGPLFISGKILLSHEPVYGLPWCLNIHGHDHSNIEPYDPSCQHINLAANVCGYTPVNLGRLIKDGFLSSIPTIHRLTIDNAERRKKERAGEGEEEEEEKGERNG